MRDLNEDIENFSTLAALFPALSQDMRSQARTICLCISDGKIIGAAECYLGPNERVLIVESTIVALPSSEMDKLSETVAPHLTSDLTAELGLHISQDGTAHFAFMNAGHGPASQICALAAKHGAAIGAEIERKWDGDSKVNDTLWSKPVTACGPDRGAALMQIRYKLDRYVVPLGESYKELLSVILSHDRFERGDMNNDFMDEEFPNGFDIVDLGIGHRRYIAAIAAILMARTKVLTERSRWSAYVSSAVKVHAFTIGLNITPLAVFATIDDDSAKSTIEIEVKTGWNSDERVAEMVIDGRLMIVQTRPKDRDGFIITYRGGLLDVTLGRLPQ